MKIKKILAVTALTVAVVALPACGKEVTDEDFSKAFDKAVSELDSEFSIAESSESSSEKESDESSEEVTEAAEEQEFAFEIESTSLGKDYDDADVLIVKYNFTNNSDKPTSFTFACQDKAFQGGIECDSTVIGCDDIDAQEQLNDIQPGKTYTVTVGYHISDLSKPVDITVTSLFDDETFLEETIDLSKI